MRKFTVQPKAVTAATKLDTHKLEQELWAAMGKWLEGPKGGFKDDSWKEDTRVEVYPDPEHPEYMIAEVRSEYLVDFDSQMASGQYLDKVVEKYDKNAYFDAYDAGISRAYLEK